jgi:Pentapeptide repeats (9 copies)
VTFHGAVSFSQAIFRGVSDFRNVDFARAADFSDTVFEECLFSGAKFRDIVDFENAVFHKGAAFDDTLFGSKAIFKRTSFCSLISFVNATMSNVASFESANFQMELPAFAGAKLHEGTVWRGAKWPIPVNSARAGLFVDSYERLKLEMDRLRKHEDELNFFALEISSRRVLAGPFLGVPIVIYRILSNYERSYVRPIVGLGITVLAGALSLLFQLKLVKAIGLSLANTFAVFGVRKDLVDPQLIGSLSAFLKVISAVQTVFGIALLFFFGLAVRNRFRMK